MSIFILTALVASYVLLGIASDNIPTTPAKRGRPKKNSTRGMRA